MKLLDLFYDVLILILEEVDSADLAACAQTCSGFNSFIKGNTRLFRTHYLKQFDDPRRDPTSPEPKWDLELQKLVKWHKILHSESLSIKQNYFRFVATIVNDLVNSSSEATGSSRNISQLTDVFLNSKNVDSFLKRSSLRRHFIKDEADVSVFLSQSSRRLHYLDDNAELVLQIPADDEDDRQLSAKIHCLHGFQISHGKSLPSLLALARSHVYDLRNYTEYTGWGPWRKDGSMRVDWEMVEALMIDLGYNSIYCHPRFRPVWSKPFAGITRNTVVKNYEFAILKELDIPLDIKDPYNISGTWIRIVSFLDWNDLYHFNFSAPPPNGRPRDPIYTREATRHIAMHLEVTKVEPYSKSGNNGVFYDCVDDSNPAFPLVHFAGTSHSLDSSMDSNAISDIKGTVRLTLEGEVRWTTISIFNGEQRWRSEGVQVGGPASERGVIGTWFDKDYSDEGPVGPTAFWKVDESMLFADDSSSEDDEIYDDGDDDDVDDDDDRDEIGQNDYYEHLHGDREVEQEHDDDDDDDGE
ncbi:hypothetical protein GQ43DRAFT_396099 [Delitschia confertaspora ATCC 74209]|uniref:F-box domain-containing protein n=1 Tax=Delitschia confertaspora ATCC 74209 TaxID=1513339 RepID=A0A9P4JLU6_9PLEO|nr:hypothetical protein GQ43DRAFT_396099 [Delitschia confertaspora ATCC 74209]